MKIFFPALGGELIVLNTGMTRAMRVSDKVKFNLPPMTFVSSQVDLGVSEASTELIYSGTVVRKPFSWEGTADATTDMIVIDSCREKIVEAKDTMQVMLLNEYATQVLVNFNGRSNGFGVIELKLILLGVPLSLSEVVYENLKE